MKLLINYFYIAILLINFCNFSIECENDGDDLSYCIIFKSNITDYINFKSDSFDWISERFEDDFGIIFINNNCNCSSSSSFSPDQTGWLLNITSTNYIHAIENNEYFMFIIIPLISTIYSLFIVYVLNFKYKYY